MVFVHGNPLHPSLIFVDKAREYLSEPPFRHSINILALPTNIILGWKSLAATKTLAYYKNS